MKKKILNGIYYLLLYAGIVTTFVLMYSYTSQTNLSALITSPLIIGIVLGLLLVFILLWIYSWKRKFTLLSSIVIFLIILCTSAYSVFLYFPFTHLNISLPFEKELSNSFILQDAAKSEKYGDWPQDNDVAHSLGCMDEEKMVPSVETFIENYKNGFRSFEVDFVPTSDGYIVCRHLWEDPDLQEGIDENNIPTLAKFESTKIAGKYTPLTLTKLYSLLLEYQDAWIVTDTKEDTIEQVTSDFQEIVKEAKEMDAQEVLDHFVIQVYTEEMLDAIQAIFPFQNIIYATYAHWDGNIVFFNQVCKYCNENHIDSVSMWNYYYCQEIQYIADYYGIDIYLHTEDDLSKAKQYLSKGVKGIYTNYLDPNQLNN